MCILIAVRGGDWMYAIRSKRSQRWFQGINTQFGRGSSHHLILDEQIPKLFKSKESARIELLSDALNVNAFDIIEVSLTIEEDVPSLSF